MDKKPLNPLAPKPVTPASGNSLLKGQPQPAPQASSAGQATPLGKAKSAGLLAPSASAVGAVASNPAAQDGPRVLADSFVTLHFKISLADADGVVADTFEGQPATLQLGTGQFSQPLEHCLIGLAEGESVDVVVEPDQAYGVRSPELVQVILRSVLDEHGEPGAEWVPGDVVEFPAPNGGTFAGVLKMIDANRAVFDFNHPLAGQRLRLQARVIGVL
jgi:FKBP-type peptidyl-prolyl cis-trans isomerase SlpA